MKDPVGHIELWQKKLDELPLHQDADAGWNAMQAMLDEQMPAAAPDSGRGNYLNAMLFLLQALIPMLVIALAAYLLWERPGRTKEKKALQKQEKTVKGEPDEEILTNYTKSTGRDPSQAVIKNKSTERLMPAIGAKEKKESSILNTNDRTGAPTSTRGSARNKGVIISSDASKHQASAPTPVRLYRGKPGNVPVSKMRKRANKQLVAINRQDPAKAGGSIQSKADGSGIDALKDNISGSLLPVMLPPSDLAHTGYAALFNIRADGTVADLADQQMGRALGSIDSGILKESARKRDELKKQLKNRYRPFIYGAKLGIVTGSNIYFGAFSSVKIAPKWFINPEAKLNTSWQVSGSYAHPSYFRPDSIKPFSITDSRKLSIMDLPLNLEFRASDKLSLHAGPLLSIAFNERGIASMISSLPDRKDTLNNSGLVDAALRQSTFSQKINIGLSTGISYHFNRFQIGAAYFTSFRPHKISSALGSYNAGYHNLQLGIGYQISKAKKTMKLPPP